MGGIIDAPQSVFVSSSAGAEQLDGESTVSWTFLLTYGCSNTLEQLLGAFVTEPRDVGACKPKQLTPDAPEPTSPLWSQDEPFAFIAVNE